MMDEMLTYKGYFGSVKYSVHDKVLHGKVEFIRDLVDYSGSSVGELKKAFESAVDDYLATCRRLNKEPEKAFKGSFNVRLGESLHRNAYFFAKGQNISLNDLVGRAVTRYVVKKSRSKPLAGAAVN